MKNIMALLVIVIVSLMSYAVADTPRHFSYAPTVASCYTKWAYEYGLADMDLEYYYSDEVDEYNKKMLFIDDLVIVYDNANLYTDAVLLYYYGIGADANEVSNCLTKASCLYCAIEYGDPWKSGIDIPHAKEDAGNFISDLAKTMVTYHDELMNGNAVIAHTSWDYGHSNCIYYLSYLQDDKQWVIYVQ